MTLKHIEKSFDDEFEEYNHDSYDGIYLNGKLINK